MVQLDYLFAINVTKLGYLEGFGEKILTKVAQKLGDFWAILKRPQFK